MTLRIQLPRPVTSCHQIEITSECNLRCPYCTHPNLGRPKMHMTWVTFERALEHVRYYVTKGTQNELNLQGIGEPTLHPDLVKLCAAGRQVVPPDKGIVHITTNGILFTEELARELAKLMVGVYVSHHRPEKSGPAAQLARKYGILLGTSNDPAENAINWAGQVNWYVTAQPGRKCPWIRMGRAFVRADGKVSTCCYDAGRNDDGLIGDVTDAVGSWVTKPYSLCTGCEQEIDVAGWDQKMGAAT